MNLEQIKFEINQKLSALKKLLQIKDFQLVHSDEGKLHIDFHGYSYPDAYENDLTDDYLGQLDEWINLCYLNELDGNKRVLLVESIIERLTFSDHFTTKEYDENVKLLNQEQIEILERFESIQWNMQKQIPEILAEKYLSEVSLDKTKIARLTWKGNQNQLAELFQRLDDRGWIDIGNNKSAFYRTLATVFVTPNSNKLLENLTDYFKKDNIPNVAFKNIPNNSID